MGGNGYVYSIDCGDGFMGGTIISKPIKLYAFNMNTFL